MAKSFYVTLPSNGSMNVFSDNTVTEYKNKLPRPLHLEGEWEVGLIECTYPYSWFQICDETSRIYIRNTSRGDEGQAYGSRTGRVSLPANLISGGPTVARFSLLRRGSSTSPSSALLRKRSRPGRGPAKRRKTAKGQKRPIGPRGRYALAKLARYKNDFPPTRPRTSSPRISPPKRKRKEDRKTISDLLHYVDLLGRI